MVQSKRSAKDWLRDVHEYEAKIAAIPDEEYEGTPWPNKDLRLLYREYLDAVQSCMEAFERQSEYCHSLTLSVVFIDAYIQPSRHLGTNDRAFLIKLRGELARAILRGTDYEYRRHS